MRTLWFILEKEFHQIFRNKGLLRMLLLTPVIQLLILPFAANFEIKNIYIAIVDKDHTSVSQKFIEKILSSKYFKLTGYNESYMKAYHLIEKDKADIILEIPRHFEEDLIKNQKQTLFVAVNAINGVKALVGSGYLNSIINDFNADIRKQWIQPEKFNSIPTIEIASSNWYNIHLLYYLFMVPGILVMLLTIVAGNMASLNIVKEKEIGTIEQINVSPIKKYHFILGKLIPFLILGIVVFTIGLIIARLAYGITPVGSIALLYLFLVVYLFCFLGFGLLISTYSQTQQQAHSLSFFFVNIFNLMSGLYTPIDSMPDWAKKITLFIPMRYFIEVIRMIVLKGSGFYDISFHLGAVFLMGLVFNVWAILNYRKTT